MTLATRCPQCGTTFRVVSDQLKLRKGLVKCGKCLHVFNGVEFLHYFSEPTIPGVENPQETGVRAAPPPVVTSAPTPEFLGVDDLQVSNTGVPDSAAPNAAVAAEPVNLTTSATTNDTPIEPSAPTAPAPAEPSAPTAPAPAPAPEPNEIKATTAAVAPDVMHRLATPPPAVPSTKSVEPRRAWYNLSPPEPRTPAPNALDQAPATAPSASERTDDRAARGRWIATPSTRAATESPRADQLDTTPAASVEMPAPDEELVATAIEPLNGDADEETRTREEVARMRTAQEADDEAATLSPLTLVDVARQSAEPAADTFEELPAFLRERRRTPRWVRALIVLLVLASALALMAQAIYAYRAEVAAEFPDLRAPIAAACSALPLNLNCEVGLPLHITQLRVTGADLQPADGGSFNLMVTIHNDASVALAYPALDVILTDVRNQVLVHRVVAADEYLGAHRDAADRRHVGLAPNAETAITVPMRILDETVVGYTVGIFYP